MKSVGINCEDVTYKTEWKRGPTLWNALPQYLRDISDTVKPLYSEQSRDPKKCSLYGGVHPRGVRYGHAHMCEKWVPPEIQCTHVCILKLTSQIYLIFESLISLNFSNKFKFFRFANMLTKTD